MGSGMNKVNPSSLNRIVKLEAGVKAIQSDLTQLVDALNKSLNQVGGQFDHFAEIINGLVSVVGADAVSAAVTAARTAKRTAEVDAAKAALQALIDNGSLVESTVVQENSVIVGRDLDAEGNEVPPGRSQLVVSSMEQSFKDAILGKGPGDVIEGTNGIKLEIKQVFDFVAQPASATPASN